jgi:NitT/TauT family transport system permease protein
MLFPLLSDVLVERLGLPFPIACTLLALFGAQWYVLFNVIAGAMSIPTDLREVASVTRSTGLRRWRRLYLPGVFPHLLTGLITAAGGAWNAAIVTEYQKIGDRLLTARGLGALISEATDAGDYRLLAASVLVLTLTLVVLNRFVWKKLYRFSDERFALNR